HRLHVGSDHDPRAGTRTSFAVIEPPACAGCLAASGSALMGRTRITVPVDAPTSSRAVAQPRRGKRAGHTWGSRRRSVRILLEQDATVTGRPTTLAASTPTAASRPGLESRRFAPTKGAGANRVLDLLSVRV